MTIDITSPGEPNNAGTGFASFFTVDAVDVAGSLQQMVTDLSQIFSTLPASVSSFQVSEVEVWLTIGQNGDIRIASSKEQAPLKLTLHQAQDVRSAPELTAATPPATASVGTPYNYTFAASGNPSPAFGVAAGALPAGLTLDPYSGVLSGTPTTKGTRTFTVSAANGVGSPATSSPIRLRVT
jgi:hypothetical protein